MRTLSIMLIASLLATGCASRPYVELGTGVNKSFTNTTHPWESQDSAAFTGELGLEWESPDRMWATKVRYMHVSQIFVGAPFSSEPESSLDHFGVAVRLSIPE